MAASGDQGPYPSMMQPISHQHLVTACFVVIAYLSGMRPGEVLSLERRVC